MSFLTNMDHKSYPDSYIFEILNKVRSIAMVGASSNWNRPSNFAMKYLMRKGFKVIPVNPNSMEKEILGENTFKISIEASTESGWKKVVGKDGVTLGMSTYGKSGPYKEDYKLFNLTSDEVVKIVKENVHK